MAEEKQKYSLISLDTGEEPVETTEVEERAGVTTTTQVIDGEETIRVSSAGRTAASVDAAVPAENLPKAADEQAPMRDARRGEEPDQIRKRHLRTSLTSPRTKSPFRIVVCSRSSSFALSCS